jgi:hypothetical protein
MAIFSGEVAMAIGQLPSRLRSSTAKFFYSLRFILLFTNTNVFIIKIYLDTSILTNSIMGQSKYYSVYNFGFDDGKHRLVPSYGTRCNDIRIQFDT